MQSMKSQGPRSLFSLATNLPVGPNPIHQFYNTLLSDCDYPLLSKILFLQLITKQNILLYSSRRAEMKQAWHGLNKKMGDHQHSILVIDENTDIRELLDLKGERRVLLFDLGKVSTQALNQLLNHPLTDFTIIAIEDQSRPLRPELSDIFPIVFRDEEDEEITTNSMPGSIPFNVQKFQSAVQANFAHSGQNKQQQAFFKPFLSMLKEKVHDSGVTLPHSRWKKMAKLVHLIGVTRAEGVFKCLSPADILLTPECLGRTPKQIEIIAKANEQTFLELIPLYSIERWTKQLSSHFWIPPSRKAYFLSLFQKLKIRPSFYYPVSKYPEVVTLHHDSRLIHYRIKGYDKKLMSDKHIQVNSKKKYSLSLKYRCNNEVIIHVGLACFDGNQNIISPVQVCRVEDSAVTVKSIEEDTIVVSEQEVALLSKWNQNGLAYQRCIGFYFQGNTQNLLSSEQVVGPRQNPYSEDKSACIYHQFSEKGISLTPLGVKQIKKIKSKVRPDQTKIMNHYQGGTYSIGGTFKGRQADWKKIQVAFKGEGRTNDGEEFLFGTQYVRIVLLVNYNSGYPDFKVQKKEAEVDVREVEWVEM